MSTDTEIPAQAQIPGDSERKLPEDWKGAFSCLVSSRIAIIQAESKEAASTGAKKVALVAIAAFCALFTWILVLAGIIGAISASTSLQWYHVAFAAAVLHVVIALVAVLMAKAKAAAPFPITRAEFEKDREWLNQLNKKPK